jgi:hypothetical protein
MRNLYSGRREPTHETDRCTGAVTGACTGAIAGACITIRRRRGNAPAESGSSEPRSLECALSRKPGWKRGLF